MVAVVLGLYHIVRVLLLFGSPGLQHTLCLQFRVCLVHDAQIWIPLEVVTPLSHAFIYLGLDMLMCVLSGDLVSFYFQSPIVFCYSPYLLLTVAGHR